ncbi:hypothetical protein [Geobacillus sp. C56-T2]|uniref:hypothetical protein n=1 Tax=Geobacillus sp. C56-T2 TaxID=600773 RepID=UPI0011A7BB75|nr:hypothetical protein [Geobacillus sp. C56-T2]
MVASPKTAKKTVDEKHRFLSHSAHFEKGSFSVRDDEGEWICYNEDKVIGAGMRDGGALTTFSEWASVKSSRRPVISGACCFSSEETFWHRLLVSCRPTSAKGHRCFSPPSKKNRHKPSGHRMVCSSTPVQRGDREK